jgi:hypothetical protein
MRGYLHFSFFHSLEGAKGNHQLFDPLYRRPLVVVGLHVVSEATAHLLRAAAVQALKVTHQQIMNGGAIR